MTTNRRILCGVYATIAAVGGIPYVWAYILGGMLIAISVTFPLFLIARERKLATADRPGLKA